MKINGYTNDNQPPQDQVQSLPREQARPDFSVSVAYYRRDTLTPGEIAITEQDNMLRHPHLLVSQELSAQQIQTMTADDAPGAFDTEYEPEITPAPEQQNVHRHLRVFEKWDQRNDHDQEQSQ